MSNTEIRIQARKTALETAKLHGWSVPGPEYMVEFDRVLETLIKAEIMKDKEEGE